MRKFTILSFILILFTAYSCKQRMVCAAFQSSYILDEERQKEQFSFFKGDSLVLTASNDAYKKDIYGLSDRKYGYWKKQDLLKVKQEDVYSHEVDSLLTPKMDVEQVDSLKRAYAEQLTDTASAEGEDAWSNTKRFHYNVDFVNYMMLVGNDVLKAQAAQRDSANAQQAQKAEIQMGQDSTKNNNKGFFKGLFKKKKDVDTEAKGSENNKEGKKEIEMQQENGEASEQENSSDEN